MNLTVELTEQEFHQVGFGETWVFVNDPHNSEDGTYELGVWGVDLRGAMLAKYLPEHLRMECVEGSDYYLSGKGKITFHNVEFIHVDYGHYNPKKDELGRISFFKNEDGTELRTESSWKNEGESSDERKDHLIEAISSFPFSFVVMNIVASPNVTFTFDPSDLINMKELDFEKHGFHKDRE